MRFLTLFAASVVAFGSAAQAHVTISPKESVTGETQVYTARVPTESASPTVALELAVPAGVTVEPSKDGKYAVKQADGRNVVTWTLNIAAGKNEELKFSAKNPDKPTELVWKFVQTYGDGTKVAWIEPAGGKRPAPTTKIAEEQVMAPGQ